MSFLYPLFLAAGAALSIPILIHLFNLRKYKTVLFPHTRFLKDIQLHSRKQSQVRYKWLLAMRLLFLAFLVLAFAQPYFAGNKATSQANKYQVIYIDNSYSTSAKKGARSILDIEKDAAGRQVRDASPGTRFILLTNDNRENRQPEPAAKVLADISAIDASAANRNVNQVLSATQQIIAGTGDQSPGNGADLYYYSDFQQSAFPGLPDQDLMKHITFTGIPVQAADLKDINIDTAYLTTPVLQTGKNNFLVVHTHVTGTPPKDNPTLSLSVNGQVKSAASLSFAGGSTSVDTLAFQVNDASWQSILLTVDDPGLRFDDTFRITARSAPNLSVLVLNEGQSNPYIQASFRAYNGFRLNQAEASAAPKDWKEYNLVILNGLTRIDETLGKTLNDALQAGQTICLFPGRTTSFQGINDGLKLAGDIHISGIDTTVQAAGSLQQGSSLVKDLFEKIPDNVQLPVANWHYVINAGLAANQQSVLSFRNGDPLLARYTPSAGQLYICATSADLQSGNFPASYFFTPFLYEMAVQGGSSSIFALNAGSRQPVFLALSNVSERNTIHLLGNGLDIIPPQRPDGAGQDVFVDEVVRQPGFYRLSTAAGGDTTLVALNMDKQESRLDFRDIPGLKSSWRGDRIKWSSISDSGAATRDENGGGFPLWKVCVILALIMLAAETYLLAKPRLTMAS